MERRGAPAAAAVRRRRLGIAGPHSGAQCVRACWARAAAPCDVPPNLTLPLLLAGWLRPADPRRSGSPLSAAITLEYYHRSRAGAWGAAECLAQDALLCGHFMSAESDFAEGVRARLIGKDDAPRWQHGSVEQVRAADAAWAAERLPAACASACTRHLHMLCANAMPHVHAGA